MYPKEYIRGKEPMGELLEVIREKKNYKEQPNGELSLSIVFNTDGKAAYAKQRLYFLFRAIRREFEACGTVPPSQPRISMRGETLTFTWPTSQGRDWKILDRP